MPETPNVVVTSSCRGNCKVRVLIDRAHSLRFKAPVKGIVLDDTVRIYPQIVYPQLENKFNDMLEGLWNTMPRNVNKHVMVRSYCSFGSENPASPPSMAQGCVYSPFFFRFL